MSEALSIVLSGAVPLRMLEFARDGGPGPDDWERAREFAWVLGAHADDLLYGGDERSRVMRGLIHALAVSAHVPGGVHFLGLQFCAAHRLYGVRQASRYCARCAESEGPK